MRRSAGWAKVLDAVRDPERVTDREALLHEALALGTDVAGGVTGCSLTVTVPGGWTTPSASQPVARTLDDAQYEAGTGPCIEAAGTGNPVRLDAIATDGRFGHFAAAAGRHGVLSSFSVPLPGAPQASALNLYATRTAAFDDARSREVAGLLARVLAGLLGAPGRAAVDTTAVAERAVRQGEVVRQAVTVHAARTGATTVAAYLDLARRTRREELTMGHVATQVLQARPAADGTSS